MNLRELSSYIDQQQGTLLITGEVADGAFASLVALTGGDMTIASCVAELSEGILSIQGQSFVPFLPADEIWEVAILIREADSAFVYDVSFRSRVTHTLASLLGKQPAFVRTERSILVVSDSALDALTLEEVVLKPEGEPFFAKGEIWTLAGRIKVPEGDNDWTPYAHLLQNLRDFSGRLERRSGGGVHLLLEAPLRQSFPLTHHRRQRTGFALTENPVLRDNTLALRLDNELYNPYSRKNDSSGALLVCRIRLTQGTTADFTLRLFQEGSVWMLSAAFEPPPGIGDMGAFLADLLGIPEAASFMRLPDGLPGVNVVKLQGIDFGLDVFKTQNALDGVEIGEISVTVAASDLWTPLIPFFKIEQTGAVFTFNFGKLLESTRTGFLLTGGVFGLFKIDLGKGNNLLLNVWMDLRTSEIVGELLVRRDQPEEPPTPLPALLRGVNLAAPGLDSLTVGYLRYEASIPARSLELAFGADMSEFLAFSVLGLSITVLNIEGTVTLSPDEKGFSLMGCIEIGKKRPFVLGAGFSYVSSVWEFRCWLCSGEVSIVALATELCGLPDPGEDPLLDLKLTRLDVRFSSDAKRPMSIAARLEQPWSARVLGVPLLLYGEIDLKKQADQKTTGTVEAGFELGRFSIIGIYRMLEEKSWLFRIAYGGGYLQAELSNEKGHDILTLSMGGTTLGALADSLIRMVNPNSSFQLSAPWDVLNRIELSAFELKFDMTDRSVSFLYRADLNLLGVLYLQEIGMRYSHGKIKAIITGKFLEKEYTVGDPLSWDAMNESPPDTGGEKTRTIKLDYLGLGQHVGSDELLHATNIADAVDALKKQFKPVKEGDPPPAGYSDAVNWLFGADMTYKGMLRFRMVLNDPSLYGVLVTVGGKKGEDSELSQLAGLSLELLYRRVTPEIGMFRAELTMPDKFRHFQFGAFSLTLGIFSLEIYTNGNFLLDLGFPLNGNFSRSFVVEAGIYTGRGGFRFGVLCGATSSSLPAITNGIFNPVVVIGLGVALGIGRSFDFSIVKGGFSLEALAVFDGIFATFRPFREDLGTAGYYKAGAMIGLKGRLFLTVDFFIISISASAEITALASVLLESYQPVHFALDFDLKVAASIKILFIKIHFSFHFSLHAEFTIGSASRPPWETAVRLPLCSQKKERSLCLRRPLRLTEGLCDGENDRVEIRASMLPLFSMENPVLSGQPRPDTVPCTAFLLTIGEGEFGLDAVLKLARAWIGAQLGNDMDRGDIHSLARLMREEDPDFYEFVREHASLVVSGIPQGNMADARQQGWLFPMPPAFLLEWSMLNQSGEPQGEPDRRDLSQMPEVSPEYLEKLHAAFAEMNPDPTPELKRGNSGNDILPLARVLFKDYFSMIVRALLNQAEHRLCTARRMPGLCRSNLQQAPGFHDKILFDNPDWRFRTDRIHVPSLTLRTREGMTPAGLVGDFALMADLNGGTGIYRMLNARRLVRPGASIHVCGMVFDNKGTQLLPEEVAALFCARLYPSMPESADMEMILRLNPNIRNWGSLHESHESILIDTERKWPVLHGETLSLLAQYRNILANPAQYEEYARLLRGLRDRGDGFVVIPDSDAITLREHDTLAALLERLYPDRSAESCLKRREECSVLGCEILEQGVKLELGACTISGCAGMRVNDFLHRYPDLSGMLESLISANGEETLPVEDLLLRPASLSRADLADLASGNEGSEAVASASRFFLQGLRIPVPENDKEWKGLYDVLGVQFPLIREEQADGDFARYRLNISLVSGERGWISLAESTINRKEIVFASANADGLILEISNDQIRDKAPAGMFSHIFAQLPLPLPTYTRERRQYPIGQALPVYGGKALAGLCGETSRRLLLPSGEFLSGGRNPGDYECLHVPVNNRTVLLEQRREGTGVWGVLIPVSVRRVSLTSTVYELSGIHIEDRLRLFGLLDVPVASVVLMSRPSEAQGKEDAVYELPLNPGSSFLVRNNLSKETRYALPRGADAGNAASHLAPLSSPGAFIRLLWECSVVGCRGAFLCADAREEISDSLWSANGDGTFWILVLPEQPQAACNCLLTGDPTPDKMQAVLQIREERVHEHPEEWTVKSVVEPGYAGFAFKIAQPEDAPVEQMYLTAGEKELLARNLFSIVSYRVEGDGFRNSNRLMPLMARDRGDIPAAWSYEETVPLCRLMDGGQDNPYAAVGHTAKVIFEYRDVLGNIAHGAPDLYASLDLTPRYNDSLLPPSQWPLLDIFMEAGTGTLNMAAVISPAACMAQGECQTHAAARLTPMIATMRTARRQIDDPRGIDASFSSSLTEGKSIVETLLLSKMAADISNTLEWGKTLNAPACQDASFGAVMQRYTLTPEAMAHANADIIPGSIYAGIPIFVPVFGTFADGGTLDSMNAPASCEGHGELALRPGVDFRIAGEGEGRAFPARQRTFAECAREIDCSLESLVLSNQTSQLLLRPGYVFTVNGYEVETGSNARNKTPSLIKICQTFLENFEIVVTPLQLVLEERPDMLRDDAVLHDHFLTAQPGETLEKNGSGCSAQTLWTLNRTTANFLANGSSILLRMDQTEASGETDLRQWCMERQISMAAFIRANAETPFASGREIHIPSRTLFPAKVCPLSKKLPGNGGTGYSITEISGGMAAEDVAHTLWGLIGILVSGRKFVFEGGETLITDDDCLAALWSRAEAIRSDCMPQLLEACILKDGIALPFPTSIRVGSFLLGIDGIKKTPSGILPIEGTMELCRRWEPNDVDDEQPDGILRCTSSVPPPKSSIADRTFSQEFIDAMELNLPFMKLAQGDPAAGSALYAVITGASREGAIRCMEFHPAAYYSATEKSPCVLSLRPVSVQLISSSVNIAALDQKGILDKPASVHFYAIDVDAWSMAFLADMERMLAPEMAARLCRIESNTLIQSLLECKELLALAIVERLDHVLQPCSDAPEADIPAARNFLADRLKESLTLANTNFALLQYPGRVELDGQSAVSMRLAGTLQTKDGTDCSVVWQTGKIDLSRAGNSCLHLLADAGALFNSSFPMEGYAYTVSDIEYDIEQEVAKYESSRWLRLLKPLHPGQCGLNVELGSRLHIPVPVRQYPQMPHLERHEIQPVGDAPDLEELLHWDYGFIYTHRMTSRDSVHICIDFNNQAMWLPDNETKTIFETLAQYMHIREPLWNLLNGNDDTLFQNVASTFLTMAQDIAGSWNNTATARLSEREEGERCEFRMNISLGKDKLILHVRMEKGDFPVLSFIHSDGRESVMERVGDRYRLDGIQEQEIVNGLSLRVTVPNLPLALIHSATTRLSVCRNEVLEPEEHAVNPAFLYKTESVGFPGPVRAFRCYDGLLAFRLPAAFSTEEEVFIRAVRYVCESLLHLNGTELPFSCQISYGYGLDGGEQIRVPVCLSSLVKYGNDIPSTLGRTVAQWAAEGVCQNDRSLWFNITLHSGMPSDSGFPLLNLANIQIILDRE